MKCFVSVVNTTGLSSDVILHYCITLIKLCAYVTLYYNVLYNLTWNICAVLGG